MRSAPGPGSASPDGSFGSSTARRCGSQRRLRDLIVVLAKADGAQFRVPRRACVRHEEARKEKHKMGRTDVGHRADPSDVQTYRRREKSQRRSRQGQQGSVKRLLTRALQAGSEVRRGRRAEAIAEEREVRSHAEEVRAAIASSAPSNISSARWSSATYAVRETSVSQTAGLVDDSHSAAIPHERPTDRPALAGVRETPRGSIAKVAGSDRQYGARRKTRSRRANG